MDHEDKEQSPPGETTSIWLPKQFEGSHLFTIRNYTLLKGLCVGAGNCISSDEFRVGDCEWKINFYPNAKNDSYYSAGYISIFLSLASSKSVKASFNLFLVDQSGGKKHKVFEQRQPCDFPRLDFERGLYGFIKRAEFESSNFLKDDCLLIRCTITVVQPPDATGSIPLPAPNTTLDLRQLLKSRKGADVSFDVNGEQFAAHKLILAARSSVFSARFFDSQKNEYPNPIKIHGIEALEFKALLNFIYCDDLPNLDDFPISMSQHLLYLSHQYDLNRLKIYCTSHVRNYISIESVSSTWALAEQCRSSELKSCCLKFVASLQNPQDVVRTSDFKNVKENNPLIAEFLESILYWKDLPTEASTADLPEKEEDPKIQTSISNAEFPKQESDPVKETSSDEAPKKEGDDTSMEASNVEFPIKEDEEGNKNLFIAA